MSALNSDLARKSYPLFATNLSGSITNSDTTIPLDSVSGLPLDTAVTITIDATDASGDETPDVKETVTGVVDSGTTSLVNCLRGVDQTTAQSHSSGAVVVQWFTANDWNDLITNILTEHVQQGHHQSLKDVNAAFWIAQLAATNAVNYLQVGNAASGSAIQLNAVGGDANIDIQISPKGTGSVVAPNGSFSSFALHNPCKFSVWASSVTSALSPTKVAYNNVEFDTGTDFDTTNHQFVAPVDGFYTFTANQYISDSNIATSLDFAIYKNGSVWKQLGFSTDSSSIYNMSITVEMQLTAGDLVSTYFWSAGHSVSTAGGQTRNYFMGYLLSQT